MTRATCSADDRLADPSPALRSVGRNRAFRALYDRYFRLVWAVLHTGGVLPSHREDVAQEVWLQVYRLVDRLRPDASARAWLVSIARRRVAHYHRTQRRRLRREAAFGEAAEDDVRPHGGQVEARSTLDRVLHGMSDEQRLTFVLVHGYGLTGEEVASAVGDSVNTVYSRLRLARRHLQRAAAAAQLEEHRVARAAVRHAQPPRHAQARLRVLIACKLGLPGLATLVPLGPGLGTASLGTAVAGLVVATGLLAGVPSSPRGSSPAPEPAPTAAALPSSSPSGPVPARPPEPALAPSPPAATGLAPEAPAAPKADHARARSSHRSATRPQAPAPDGPSLQEETDVLKRAKRALDAGEPSRALAMLDEHERAFPRGALEDVRQGIRVRALCALGRPAEARQAGLHLASSHDRSVVAHGVEDVCAPPASDDHASGGGTDDPS